MRLLTERKGRDLEGDPEFAMVFSSLATWLAPVDGALHLRAIRQRNPAYPSAQILIGSLLNRGLFRMEVVA